MGLSVSLSLSLSLFLTALAASLNCTVAPRPQRRFSGRILKRVSSCPHRRHRPDDRTDDSLDVPGSLDLVLQIEGQKFTFRSGELERILKEFGL